MRIYYLHGQDDVMAALGIVEGPFSFSKEKEKPPGKRKSLQEKKKPSGKKKKLTKTKTLGFKKKEN